MKIRTTSVAAIAAACLLLSGCGAMSTAIQKRNLDVKTQMSQTIWLEPSSNKTVWVQVRNTSDKDMGDLYGLIGQDLQAKGYTLTSSPDAANYWVQANVLKADKMDLRQAQGFLSNGYEVQQWARRWAAALLLITVTPVVPCWVPALQRALSGWQLTPWCRT